MSSSRPIFNQNPEFRQEKVTLFQFLPFLTLVRMRYRLGLVRALKHAALRSCGAALSINLAKEVGVRSK
jgi:hypothetical protein